LKDYPYIFDARRRSILCPQLQKTVLELADAIRHDQEIDTPLSNYKSHLAKLPAKAIVRAAGEIRDLGHRVCRPTQSKGFWIFSGHLEQDRTLKHERRALRRYPDLAIFFLFHGDGRIREAALVSLKIAPGNPFAFAALVYRMNDWVPQVRDAAFKIARKLFPQVTPGIVADACFFLFTQVDQLGRWGDKEQDLLHATLYRPDVQEALAERLLKRPIGHVGRVMRLALKRPGLDHLLPRLASNAALPHVRAIAYEALIFRRATWMDGYERQWIDRRYNLWRRVPRFEFRPIDNSFDVEDLIVAASQDRAAVVRKVATRGLIELGQGSSRRMITTGENLSRDHAPLVRSRAEFFLKNLDRD